MTQSIRSPWRVIGLCCCIIPLGAASAQTSPAIRWLDFQPLDLSADGSVVVGTSSFLWVPPAAAIRWTASGTQRIAGEGTTSGWPLAHATHVSADGRTIYGDNRARGGWEPEYFVWTAATGVAALPELSGVHW